MRLKSLVGKQTKKSKINAAFLHLYRYYYCYYQHTFFHLFIYSLVSIIRITTIVTISTFFFRLVIPLFFLIECQATCFKNSSYIFSKSGRGWYDNRHVCVEEGFDLVSIETEEEWKFIKHEIQKRDSWNTGAWHIGLWQIGGVWSWLSGEKLNISKWRDSEPDSNDDYAEISKRRGLFNGISRNYENAYICEIPGGMITFQTIKYIIC